MPNQYRAPEVVLKMSWDQKVDVWNMALVAWDIVSTRSLFQGRNTDGIFDDRVDIAEMIALVGSPPPEFFHRSEVGYISHRFPISHSRVWVPKSKATIRKAFSGGNERHCNGTPRIDQQPTTSCLTSGC
ncbi:hypothetical protein NUU61_002205 [Penicillium alfredii]|uniref:Protein kinase domain-containing protein n=1 Tax=Penicillium alfredii TaxID=1506179 RepID=A0A9W9FR66_9EURO|nr:uncharacterized protein NUU61_002205 [Penicillium alfredii]KAJ5104858.1 hypothetical protein NUU61_002205 [Penicillium alfredii]